MGGNGLTGFIVYLQRPDDPLPVRRVKPLPGIGIDALQQTEHGFHALGVRLCFQLSPHACGGEGGKLVAPDQAVHVKSGAAGDDGGFAPGDDIVHDGSGHSAVAADGEVLVRVRHIDHVVGDSLTLFRTGLGGADIHAAVDLHGIAGYHFAVEFLCQFHSQSGLAGGGRPGDTYDVVHGLMASDR